MPGLGNITNLAGTVSAGATIALPWLAEIISTDVSTLAISLATIIGLGIGAFVPIQRFGLARLGLDI